MTAVIKVRKAIVMGDVSKAIALANENFKRMNKSEKRVAIAKDVIAQLKLKTYKAKTGSYVMFKTPVLFDDPSRNMIEVFSQMQSCQVCARGAMFVSACRTLDQCTVKDINIVGGGSDNLNSWHIEDYEGKFFEDKQICLIESAFEKQPMGNTNTFNHKKDEFGDIISYHPTVEKAVAFGKKYPKSEVRMIAIMKNIIKNNGKFVP